MNALLDSLRKDLDLAAACYATAREAENAARRATRRAKAQYNKTLAAVVAIEEELAKGE